MCLCSHEVGVHFAREFEHLHDGLFWMAAAEDEAVFFEGVEVAWVDFVAVAEAEARGGGVVVEGGDEGAGGEFDVLAAEAHVTAETFDFFLFGEDVDDGIDAGGLELGGVSVGEFADVAGVFDDGHLETEADAEEGDFIFAGEADAFDFAFDAAVAEAAGDDDTVEALEPFGDEALAGGGIGRAFGPDFAGVDPFDIDPTTGMGGTMFQRFIDGGVGVADDGVFAGDADGDGLFLGREEVFDKLTPICCGPGLPCVG